MRYVLLSTALWIVSALIGSNVAGQSLPDRSEETLAAPVPPLTSADDDFASVLNWFSAAKPEEQDRLIQDSDALLKETADRTDSSDLETTAKITFLRTLVQEERVGRKAAIKGYVAMANNPETPPTFGATAALRSAQLMTDDQTTATRNIAIARLLNPDGYLWFEQDGSWKKEMVDVAAKLEFSRLDPSFLTWRAAHWLAERVRPIGTFSPVVSMFILFLTIRILEIPLMMKALPQLDLYMTDQPCQWRYLVIWLLADGISHGWIDSNLGLWIFVFEPGQVPSFFWFSSLMARDPIAEITVGVSVGAYLIPLFLWPLFLRELRGNPYLFSMAVVLILGMSTGSIFARNYVLHYFDLGSLHDTAWMSVYNFMFGVTAFLVVTGCRIGMWWQKRDSSGPFPANGVSPGRSAGALGLRR